MTVVGLVVLVPLIAGPITKVERANIAAKRRNPIAGARHVWNLRRRRNNIGIESRNPSTPKRAVPPDPATRAVPARNPT